MGFLCMLWCVGPHLDYGASVVVIEAVIDQHPKRLLRVVARTALVTIATQIGDPKLYHRPKAPKPHTHKNEIE
eukprot:1779924-Amphidinium_carterae.1